MTNEQIISSLQSLKEYAYNTANQSNDSSVATNVTIRVNLRDFMFVMDEAISALERKDQLYKYTEV